MKHRERYPEQYTHELCGKRVRVNSVEGVVVRVVSSQHGQLAHLSTSGATAYPIEKLTVIPHAPMHIVMPDDPDDPEIATLTPAQAVYFENEGYIRVVSKTADQVLYDLPALDFEEFKMLARQPK